MKEFVYALYDLVGRQWLVGRYWWEGSLFLILFTHHTHLQSALT